MEKGQHLLIDCQNVPRDVCLDDGKMLDVMARAAAKAGMHVISQVRYHFGHNSAPGFTCVCLLDESHVSAHTYADLGLVALDVFTCGPTDPAAILEHMRTELDLGDVQLKTMPRFRTTLEHPPGEDRAASDAASDKNSRDSKNQRDETDLVAV